MSLIVVARFENGVLFAGDPFVFDNDGEIPQKRLDFNKVVYSLRFRFAVAAVGSRWVFSSFLEWIESNEVTPTLSLETISLKWLNLNREWKEKRCLELAERGEKTLRDISDSILFFADATDLETIWIADPNGQISSSKSFVLSGSGSYLVKLFLEKSGKSFNPSATFSEAVTLVKECYTAAACDLYVFGLPSMAIFTSNQFIDLSKECEEVWCDSRNQYFTKIQELLLARYDNRE